MTGDHIVERQIDKNDRDGPKFFVIAVRRRPRRFRVDVVKWSTYPRLVTSHYSA